MSAGGPVQTAAVEQLSGPVLELLRGVDLAAGTHKASRRAHEILLKLDSEQEAHRHQALELINSLTDVVEAVFLLSAMQSACEAITRLLAAGPREIAQARDEEQGRQTRSFPDPGVNDEFLFIQLRGTTTRWAMLALDHARQVWPDRQQRADYLAAMARVAYEAGN